MKRATKTTSLDWEDPAVCYYYFLMLPQIHHSHNHFPQRQLLLALPHHLLTGHGATLDKFEKRDLATTCNLSYQNRETANQIIHPTTYHINDPLGNKL